MGTVTAVSTLRFAGSTKLNQTINAIAIEIELKRVQKVAQIARSRPVSRQSIQKLTNEMIKEGLIKSVDNSAHKKSKLLVITARMRSIV